MNILTRDYETRSTVDLGDVGVSIYAQHSDTRVLCVGYRANGNAAKLWKPGEAVPQEFIDAAKHPDDWATVAHGASFEMAIERRILGPQWGFPVFSLEQNVCTMAMANALALPAGLDRLCKVLNLGYRKDVVGSRVMKQLTKPRKARKGENPNATHWFDDDVRMQQLFAYCLADVNATHEVAEVLPWLSDDERAVWQLDQRINERGFYLDVDLINAARKIVAEAHPRINAKLEQLTAGYVTAFTQVAKLKEWLRPHIGDVDLNKGNLDELLAYTEGDVRDVIELRKIGAQAAAAKPEALLLRRDKKDGRLRHAFVYHAAGTGRWCVDADTLIDTPIRPRRIVDLVTGDLVIGGSGQPRKVLAKLYKGREPMYKLIGPDAFIIATAGHRIMTERGWKRIDDCFQEMADGRFVLRRSCTPISYATTYAPVETWTLVLVGERDVWDITVEGDESYCAQGLIHHNSSRGAQVHNLKRSMTKDVEEAVKVIGRGDFDYAREHYENPLSVIGDLVRAMIHAAPGKTFIGGDFSGIEARVTAWVANEERKLEVFRAYDRGEGPDPYLVAAADIDAVDIAELVVAYKAEEPWARESRQRGKAAELAFGFQGGVNAYRRFAPDTDLTDDQIDTIKRRWRAKHPNIERFWYAVGRAAIHAVRHPGELVFAGRISFICDDQPFLFMTLPSGRRISYPDARWRRSLKLDTGHLIMDHVRGDWGVHFKDNTQGQWRDTRIYGGFLTENCLAADTQVLTTEGWKQIAFVQKSDKVWDGVEWVAHHGVVHRGIKETAALDGIRMTADHKVLTDHGWIRATQAQGLHRAKVRLPHSGKGCWFNRTKTSLEASLHMRQDARKSVERIQYLENTIVRMQKSRDVEQGQYHAWDVKTPRVLCLAFNAGSMPPTDTPSMEKLRWAWDQGLSALGEIQKFLGRHGADIQTWASPRSQEQRQRLFQSELPMDHPSTQSTKQSHDQYAMGEDDDRRSGATFGAWQNNSALPHQSYATGEMVYDIANCGPRQRFVVRGKTEPFIVHNCVQGIARDLLSDAMRRIDAAGYTIVTHVHDECVIEAKKIAPKFAQMMMVVPAWAEGLPLVAKPWCSDRYVK